jgi:hypothetical protein
MEEFGEVLSDCGTSLLMSWCSSNSGLYFKLRFMSESRGYSSNVCLNYRTGWSRQFLESDCPFPSLWEFNSSVRTGPKFLFQTLRLLSYLFSLYSYYTFALWNNFLMTIPKLQPKIWIAVLFQFPPIYVSLFQKTYGLPIRTSANTVCTQHWNLYYFIAMSQTSNVISSGMHKSQAPDRPGDWIL